MTGERNAFFTVHCTLKIARSTRIIYWSVGQPIPSLANDCDETKDHVRMGHFILSHLKSVLLLEEGMTGNHVTMHKIMWQVALYISEVDYKCKYLVKTNGVLRDPPDRFLEREE